MTSDPEGDHRDTSPPAAVRHDHRHPGPPPAVLAQREDIDAEIKEHRRPTHRRRRGRRACGHRRSPCSGCSNAARSASTGHANWHPRGDHRRHRGNRRPEKGGHVVWVKFPEEITKESVNADDGTFAITIAEAADRLASAYAPLARDGTASRGAAWAECCASRGPGNSDGLDARTPPINRTAGPGGFIPIAATTPTRSKTRGEVPRSPGDDRPTSTAPATVLMGRCARRSRGHRAITAGGCARQLDPLDGGDS